MQRSKVKMTQSLPWRSRNRKERCMWADNTNQGKHVLRALGMMPMLQEHSTADVVRGSFREKGAFKMGLDGWARSVSWSRGREEHARQGDSRAKAQKQEVRSGFGTGEFSGNNDNKRRVR